ncbi:MAG: flagellar assembly protein FliW [Candidatus Anammoxibacter sp.]
MFNIDMDVITVNTGQFGEINVNPDNIITFVQPILGFDEFRKYVLIEDQKFFPIQWIQSVENSDLAFPIVNPGLLNIKYDIDAASTLISSLKLRNTDAVTIYTLLVIPSNSIDDVRTNLKAPIFINLEERLAVQVVYEDSKYPVRYFLFKGQEINMFKDEGVGAVKS